MSHRIYPKYLDRNAPNEQFDQVIRIAMLAKFYETSTDVLSVWRHGSFFSHCFFFSKEYNFQGLLFAFPNNEIIQTGSTLKGQNFLLLSLEVYTFTLIQSRKSPILKNPNIKGKQLYHQTQMRYIIQNSGFVHKSLHAFQVYIC